MVAGSCVPVDVVAKRIEQTAQIKTCEILPVDAGVDTAGDAQDAATDALVAGDAP